MIVGNKGLGGPHGGGEKIGRSSQGSSPTRLAPQSKCSVVNIVLVAGRRAKSLPTNRKDGCGGLGLMRGGSGQGVEKIIHHGGTETRRKQRQRQPRAHGGGGGHGGVRFRVQRPRIFCSGSSSRRATTFRSPSLAYRFFLRVSVPPKKQIYVLLKMGMLYPFD